MLGDLRITVRPRNTTLRATVKAPVIQAQAVRTLPKSTPAAASSVQTSWTAYQHTGIDLTLAAGVRTLLPLGDSLAPAVSNLPDELSSHDFFVDGKFQPVGVTPGGKYRLRLNVDVTSLLGNNDLRFELDIGGGQGVVDSVSESCHADAGTVERITPAFDFYTYDTFIANGGSVYVTARSDAAVSDLLVLVVVERIE